MNEILLPVEYFLVFWIVKFSKIVLIQLAKRTKMNQINQNEPK